MIMCYALDTLCQVFDNNVRPVSLDVIERFSLDIFRIVGMRSPAAIEVKCMVYISLLCVKSANSL